MNHFVPSPNGRRVGTLVQDPVRLLENLVTRRPEVVWSATPTPLEVTHTADGATVSVDVPGVDAKDIELTFEVDSLGIVAKRGERTYRYQVTLDSMIDASSITAHLDKGVLMIEARKRAEAKPRKIAVQVGAPPRPEAIDG